MAFTHNFNDSYKGREPEIDNRGHTTQCVRLCVYWGGRDLACLSVLQIRQALARGGREEKTLLLSLNVTIRIHSLVFTHSCEK